MNNYKNTLVIAPVFGFPSIPREVGWMLQSAALNGIEVHLVGHGQPFLNTYDAKVTQLWNILKDVNGYDHIMMVDATDTLFTTGLGEFHFRWKEYNSDFVISGESNNWPFANRYKDHPLKNERFGCLNSGFYLATRDAFHRTMKYLIEMKDDGYTEENQTVKNQDQATFWRAYMEGLPITIDYKCKLSQCTRYLDHNWVLGNEIIWGRRPYNTITKSCPCSIHCNGEDKWRLRGVYEQIIK